MIRIPIDKGLVGATAQSGKFIHVKDAYQDSRFDQDIDRKTGNTTRNILCAPLMGSHGACLGVVQVLNKHQNRSFSEEDEKLIKSFAAQAACSLENLQMFQHIHKLQQYANSVKPTADCIALLMNKTGHIFHSSINPQYVLGVTIEEMRTSSFSVWLVGSKHTTTTTSQTPTGRNIKLATSMARILGFEDAANKSTRNVTLHNYSYTSPQQQTILMNVTLVSF